MPTNINYQANIWALKEEGCTHLLVTTACGSLREEIQPGDIVIIDQFIDRWDAICIYSLILFIMSAVERGACDRFPTCLCTASFKPVLEQLIRRHSYVDQTLTIFEFANERTQMGNVGPFFGYVEL